MLSQGLTFSEHPVPRWRSVLIIPGFHKITASPKAKQYVVWELPLASLSGGIRPNRPAKVTK